MTLSQRSPRERIRQAQLAVLGWRRAASIYFRTGDFVRAECLRSCADSIDLALGQHPDAERLLCQPAQDGDGGAA